MGRKSNIFVKGCRNCGSTFSAFHSRAKYCSRKCGREKRAELKIGV